MILKVNFKFLSAILGILFVYSCNGNDSENEIQSDSADAQIYSFTLTATPITSADTVNYNILAATKFLIDPGSNRIYNPEPLPYGTVLRKFFAVLTYSRDNISGVDIIYPDNTVAWNTTDSIDFTTNKVAFEVTPANGKADYKRKYTIDIRVHKIDQDTLIWNEVPAAAWSGISPTKQKVVAKGSSYFYFASTSGTSSVREFNPQTETWVANAQSTSKNILVESILVFNNKFLAIGATGNTFSSDNGIAWTDHGNKNAYSVLGIIPGKTTADDNVLLLVKEGAKYKLTSTTDMTIVTPIDSIAGSTSDTVPANFAAANFASVTKYDKSNPAQNYLILTGGRDFNNNASNLTWLIKNGDKAHEIAQNSLNSIFAKSENIATFIYDTKVYAIVDKVLYTSTSFGLNWAVAPDKQPLPKELEATSQKTILVDSQNFIWMFEADAASGKIKVWKGRLNRLIPRN